LNIKPKLLFITDWYAPAFKGGGPIRSVVNLIEKIKKDYDCYVYTSNTDFGEVEPLAGIVEDQWVDQDGVQVYYRSGKMSFAQVKTMIKNINPHRIYLNSMFSNMIKPILVAFASDKIIIAPRGMLNESALAVKPIRKFLYLWFLRTFGFAKHLRFHATSEEEKKVIKRIFPNAQSIVVAGNIPTSTATELLPVEKQSGKLNIVFTGRMHPIKNLHLLLEALKNVSGAIELTIIATQEDQLYLERCNRLAIALPSNITINWVLDLPPTEIKRYLLQAHLFALLSNVESFGHAIFEALAIGCPVLISDNTPWKNLQQQKAGMDFALNHIKNIESGLQLFVDMENNEWQSFRKGAHNLAQSYIDNLNVDKLYRSLFEN
jgi:glycosyltransferase involved in cell wall biosynthesis